MSHIKPDVMNLKHDVHVPANELKHLNGRKLCLKYAVGLICLLQYNSITSFPN